MSLSSIRLLSLLRCALPVILTFTPAFTSAQSLGIFQQQKDVGTVLHPGSVKYDATKGTYTVTGSGDNMWFAEDDFHYLWTKVSGDVALTADIDFVGATGNNHRKAVLMIRESLDTDSKSVDLARHGDGLTSLQFRETTGGHTHEVEANAVGPKTVRLEKRGDYFYAFVSGADGKLHVSGASTKLSLASSFYIGIGVSAHDKNVTETAIFSNVKLTHLPAGAEKLTLYSALETTTVASTDRHVEYVAPSHFEAPNWSRDGSFFLFNSEGHIMRLPLKSDTPVTLSTDLQNHCNNDHGISPDGQSIAISDQGIDNKSKIYLLPIAGGTPRQLTNDGPSYWHGWSPDGKTIAFTGQRNNEFDIYTVPAAGGPETRLTTAHGLDDGSEFSPDGQYIYFNSERTGSMQIWRMRADGSQQERVLTDDTNDWFPHLSPDGKWMVFLSYDKDVTGHPPLKDVVLNLMSMQDKSVHVLAKLFGGQGTINVPSWSPDSRKLAFVSYELLPNDKELEK